MTAPARPPSPAPQGIRGCPPGGGGVRRGCHARWEHPPRPALRTLILRADGAGPEGAPDCPRPGPIAAGVSGRRQGTGAVAARIVRRPPVGRVRVFVGAAAWGEPASLRGGVLGGRRRHEHRKEARSIRGGAAAGPLRRPAVQRARSPARSETFVRRPLDQFFSRVLGLRFLLPSRPAAPSWRLGVGGAGRPGLARRVGGEGSRCPPARARLLAPPPRSRSLRKLRP